MKVLFRTFVTTLLFVGSALTAYGQIILRGTVTTDSGEAAAFANVLLCSAKDSTDVIASAMVDMQGTYSLPKQREGRYTVIVQLVGYRTIAEQIQLRMPSLGDSPEIVRDFVLMAEAEQIDGVVVKAHNVTQQLDRTVYNISQEDRKHAFTALDLTLKVPQLRLDPVSQCLTSAEGAIKIFINGAASSEQELKSLRPTDIKSMEYYDLPPMRYGGGTTKVLNVITKGAVEGIYGGIDLSHAFTTGFFNDSFYLRYNRGRGQFAVSYYGSYRNYHHRDGTTVYDYTLGGEHFNKTLATRQKFGYFTNNIRLQYTSQVQDDYLFQVNFLPNFTNRHYNIASEIDFLTGEILSKRHGEQGSFQKTFSPSLNMYLWKQLDNRQEIIANLVGTYFDASDDSHNDEYADQDNRPLLNDFNKTRNHKYSVIGQVVYTKNFERLSLSVGEYLSFEALDSYLNNTFTDSRYQTQVLTNQTYAELTGNHLDGKLQYRLSIGATGRHTASREVDSWDWVFTPSIVAGYQFTPTLMLRAGFSQYNTSPSLSQLSNNISLIADNIIRRGNPYLKNGFSNNTFLGISYTNNWLSIYGSGFFGYSKNPINSYFIEGEHYMELVQENADFGRYYGFNYTVQVSPFKNRLLTLKLQGAVGCTEYSSRFYGLYKHLTAPLFYEITCNWKDFSLFYQGNLRTYTLQSNNLLVANEPMSNLGVRYRYKDWSFSVTCIGFVVDYRYETKSVPDSAVYYYDTNTIHDNENMILVSVGYQFGKGRLYQERARKIDNADTDSGL